MAQHILTDDEWNEYQDLKKRFLDIKEVRENQLPGNVVVFYGIRVGDSLEGVKYTTTVESITEQVE